MVHSARFQKRLAFFVTVVVFLLVSLLTIMPVCLKADQKQITPPKSPPALPESLQIYQDRYPAISLYDLKLAMENNAVTLIDSNKADTYKKNHIPGALSLPALIEHKSSEDLPTNKNRMIVVYCGGPQCTAWFKAADYASRHGFKHIRHFKGGIKEWQETNQLFENNL